MNANIAAIELRVMKVLRMLALTAVAAAAPATAASSEMVFRCSFGSKQVSVTTFKTKLRYEFGVPGAPMINLLGDPALRTVRYHSALFAHAEHSQLRFVSGGYHYLLFNRFSTPDYRGRGAEDRSGLQVLHGGKPIATLWCRAGPGFSTTCDFKVLPDDGEDAVPE